MTLRGHTGRVTSVAITPNGRCAVSAGYDKSLSVWDLESGQLEKTLKLYREILGFKLVDAVILHGEGIEGMLVMVPPLAYLTKLLRELVMGPWRRRMLARLVRYQIRRHRRPPVFPVE